MRERIDAGHLCARCFGLRLPSVGLDLYQRGMHGRGWLGVVLRERLYGWGDAMLVDYEPADLCRGCQRLHLLRHLNLHQRGMHGCGWLGVVLHERLHCGDDVLVGHQPSDLCRRGQRLHCLHHHGVHLRGRGELCQLRGFKLGRMAHAQ
jgi:hypothetical protein